MYKGMAQHSDPAELEKRPQHFEGRLSDVSRGKVVDWLTKMKDKHDDDVNAARASVGSVVDEPPTLDPATLELGRLMGRAEVLNEAAEELARGTTRQDEQVIIQPTLFEDV